MCNVSFTGAPTRRIESQEVISIDPLDIILYAHSERDPCYSRENKQPSFSFGKLPPKKAGSRVGTKYIGFIYIPNSF